VTVTVTVTGVSLFVIASQRFKLMPVIECLTSRSLEDHDF
jgi:hypothetical protein